MAQAQQFLIVPTRKPMLLLALAAILTTFSLQAESQPLYLCEICATGKVCHKDDGSHSQPNRGTCTDRCEACSANNLCQICSISGSNNPVCIGSGDGRCTSDEDCCGHHRGYTTCDRTTQTCGIVEGETCWRNTDCHRGSTCEQGKCTAVTLGNNGSTATPITLNVDNNNSERCQECEREVMRLKEQIKTLKNLIGLLTDVTDSSASSASFSGLNGFDAVLPTESSVSLDVGDS